MGNIYTPLKIFRYTEKVRSLPVTSAETLPPIHVRIKPTNACNHRCSYCAYRSDALQLGEEMNLRDRIPQDKMAEIVDDLVAMGVLAVTFSGGGEPFLYPHLADTADLLVEGGVKIASLTNGSRLQGRAAEVFSARATWLRVSIDGWDGPSYAAYRGVGDDEFRLVIGNLRAFKRLGGSCRLGASLIVDEVNSGHVFDLAAILADTGLDSIKISPCIIGNDGAANNRYHQPFFQGVREQIAKIRESLARPGFEIQDAYHTQLDSFAKPYTWCPYLQILPIIGADLNVYSCQDKAYTAGGLLGSIRQRRFRDFWFNSRENFFRINPLRDCDHHCVAHNKNLLLHEYLAADEAHADFV